jgi:hypothetical protein
VHLANFMDHTCVAKNTFSRRRLTGIYMCRNSKVSLIFKISHDYCSCFYNASVKPLIGFRRASSGILSSFLSRIAKIASKDLGAQKYVKQAEFYGLTEG